MALNKFGLYIRQYRLVNGITLKDMAEKVQISGPYLSSIENNKKPIPADLGDKIANEYSFSDEQKKELFDAIENSFTLVTVDTQGDELNLEIMSEIRKGLNDLTVEQKKEILDILKGNR